MGITFVQKSDLNNPKPNPKIALVLSGGAVSGGAFKLGGLNALSNFMINQNIRDFDIYVGVSAGSIISILLANGVPTSEISKSMSGRKGMLDPIMASEFYYFNYKEFISKPLMMFGDLVTRFPRAVYHFLKTNNLFQSEFRRRLLTALANPIYDNIEAVFSMAAEADLDSQHNASIPWGYIPNGIFNTDNFEKSIRNNLERNRLCNDFKELYKQRGKRLYIAATKLDTAQRVIFGPDEINTVTISKSMQASIAVPLFYKPVRIDGSDYVDGGVIKTASMDIAIDKGADLVICYNPFRPINFEIYSEREQRKHRLNIADDGLYALINQVFRTLLHTRLMHGMEYYRTDPKFKGDIILIEPTDYDHKFFDMNPLAFWERRKAAKRGYESVKESISQNYELLQKILNAYGIVTSWEFAQDPEEMYRQQQNLKIN
ncbi:MAG: Phospholipase [Candidatus Magnetoglobus multicellularis str. Araruama]|uniref:Phospholipase n=1 Tax=Candidatus Magnetoglobus multicellularis str. Araruama TaxID=890399 RepID=A0A1V1PGA2_9BACT|nr:MAG: Phospholipase [Candidatus Magnetoglobus multicellularis str. Araruama]